jgi:hypothetical protein
VPGYRLCYISSRKTLASLRITLGSMPAGFMCAVHGNLSGNGAHFFQFLRFTSDNCHSFIVAG